MDKLANERPFAITPNLTYPLIKYATTKAGEKLICVSIPEKQFTFHAASGVVPPFVAWHPPLWFYVRLSPANIPTGVKIGVVLDRPENPENAEVFHLPFPNIYPNGSICFGGTHMTNTTPDKPLTEAAAIELTYQRIFNSEFNHDLVESSEESEFERLAKADPEWQNILPIMRNTTSPTKRYALKLQLAFKERAGVFKYHYVRRGIGDNFLGSL
jgi:hypothetical protein